MLKKIVTDFSWFSQNFFLDFHSKVECKEGGGEISRYGEGDGEGQFKTVKSNPPTKQRLSEVLKILKHCPWAPKWA